MAIAITAEHRDLAATTRAFLRAEKARAAGRELLEAPEEPLPPFWAAFADLGLLGVHVPEEYGGGGYGLAELAVVVEELGREVAPGPLLPTMLASAALAHRGTAAQCARYLPGLVDGSTPAALGLGGSLRLEPSARGAALSGDGGVVLGAGPAELLILAAGDDLVVLPADAPGLRVLVPDNLDPTRRAGQVRLDAVTIDEEQILHGARRHAQSIARALAAAEAAGGASECVEAATGYAKVREQFGRVIGGFQAVKHHCADMLVAAELATAAAWDAMRAASGPDHELELAAAVALALAAPAFVGDAQLNIQVHGGIGFTWEHDAHLLLRRANALAAVFDPEAAAADVARLVAAGVGRELGLDLPAHVEERRAEVRAAVQAIAALDLDRQRSAMIETGYYQPHWPAPFGLGADAGLQLLIDQEFQASGLARPSLGITGWVILTLIQLGAPAQIARFVGPALAGDEVWCQLFSEPQAGSDAAAVRTRAVRTEGGWIVNGQKVWTSDAQNARYGLATVRTAPDVPKHKGITAVVIDMRAPGVEVRPLRQITGQSEFNEVFLTEVFVPDADVVGEVNAGWSVARTTLGNERVSIGGSTGDRAERATAVRAELIRASAADPAAQARVGHHFAEEQGLRLLNLRGAERAVAGAAPGPEGNITKLVLARHALRSADLLAEFAGPDLAFTEGPGALAAESVLGARGLSIAGGTSEITRNQIAERILGLPREPLV